MNNNDFEFQKLLKLQNELNLNYNENNDKKINDKKINDKEIIKNDQENIKNDQENKEEVKQIPNRCKICSKKLGLIPFICRCKGQFCALHRYSHNHNCDFDYQQMEKERLEKENPIIKSCKIK